MAKIVFVFLPQFYGVLTASFITLLYAESRIDTLFKSYVAGNRIIPPVTFARVLVVVQHRARSRRTRRRQRNDHCDCLTIPRPSRLSVRPDQVFAPVDTGKRRTRVLRFYWNVTSSSSSWPMISRTNKSRSNVRDVRRQCSARNNDNAPRPLRVIIIIIIIIVKERPPHGVMCLISFRRFKCWQ